MLIVLSVSYELLIIDDGMVMALARDLIFFALGSWTGSCGAREAALKFPRC